LAEQLSEFEPSHAFPGATCLNLPGSSVRDQHVGELGILREAIPVDLPAAFDQLKI